jgi:hypothetical protein
LNFYINFLIERGGQQTSNELYKKYNNLNNEMSNSDMRRVTKENTEYVKSLDAWDRKFVPKNQK